MNTSDAPPASQDAEEMVLGALLVNNAIADPVMAELEPEGGAKFWRGSHGALYTAIAELNRQGRPHDELTVIEELRRTGVLDSPDGLTAERVHELAILVPTTSNAPHHARIIRDLWAKRTLAGFFQRGYGAAMNGAEADVLLAHTERRVGELRDELGRRVDSEATSLGVLAQQLEERVKNPPATIGGVAPPFSFMSPLRPGRLYILAGFTGHGKTAMATQYLQPVSKQGGKVVFFSIEMSKDQLFDRLIASFGIPLSEVESGRISANRMHTYEAALAEVSRWQVHVIDSRDANAETVRRVQRKVGYDFVIIDHLHEIELGGKPTEQRQLLEMEVRRITTVARDENVPVLLLAQLRRVEGRTPFPRPSLNLLKETGKIEQEAAMVSFIWRKPTEDNLPGVEAEFITAKNRFGPVGKRDLWFDGDRVRFVEMSQ